MENDVNLHQSQSGDRSFVTSRTGLVLIAFLAISGALLLTEHRAHVLGALPYLLLPACLLMHVFMHKGHGGHHHHDQHNAGARAPREGAADD